MLRRAAAVFLVLHGIAHAIGFLGSWQLGEFKDAPFTTLILNGTVDVGELGMRLVGLLWLVGAAAFIAAGVAVWRTGVRAIRVVGVVTVYSLALCVIGLPAASMGLVINVAILVALAALLLAGAARRRAVAR